MKRLWMALVAAGCLTASVEAQGATSASKFGWDIVGPDLATVQAYTYKHYDDGAATGVAFSGVVCTGTASPFVCSVPIPAYTPGNHTMSVTASNVAGESAKSSPLGFVFVITPSVPGNPRII